MSQDLTIALTTVRNRLAALADSIIRAELAQQRLRIALKAASDAGAGDTDMHEQLKIVTAERPKRAEALERLALLSR